MSRDRMSTRPGWSFLRTGAAGFHTTHPAANSETISIALTKIKATWASTAWMARYATRTVEEISAPSQRQGNIYGTDKRRHWFQYLCGKVCIGERVWDTFATVIAMKDKIAGLTETEKTQQWKIEDLHLSHDRIETAFAMLI